MLFPELPHAIDTLGYEGFAVLPEYLDRNGHMNVGYYSVLFDQALGADEAGGVPALKAGVGGIGRHVVDHEVLHQREGMRPERLDDEGRGQVIGHAHGLAQEGLRVQRRPLPASKRIGTELIGRAAIERHVTARRQRVGGSGPQEEIVNKQRIVEISR